MSKKDKLTQRCARIGRDLIAQAVKDFSGATGLDLYAFNMAAPGISSRFSHEQMGRFLVASLEVEAKALAMADPETAAVLADYDGHIQSLVDECKTGDNEFMDDVGAALARVIQRRSVIVRLNHAVHERAAVDALLAEGAGQGGFGRVLAAIADGTESALRRKADVPAFDDSIPGQGGDHG